MIAGRLGALAGAWLLVPSLAIAQTADWARPIELAQAQSKDTPEEQQKRKQQPREKAPGQERGQPPQVKPQPQFKKVDPAPKGPPPVRKAEPPPPPPPRTSTPPPGFKKVEPLPEKGPAPFKKVAPRPDTGTPPPERKALKQVPNPNGEPPAAKAIPKKGFDGKKDGLPKSVQPKDGLPKDKGPTTGVRTPPPGKGPSGAPPAVFGTPPADRVRREATPQPRFDELQKGRTQRTEDGGKRIVIREPGPGNRVIVRQDNRIIIRHDESERFRRLHRDARSERRPDGSTETYFVRPDGVRVVSIVDANGRLVRRYRRDRGGREFNIIDNRRFLRNAGIAIGVGAIGLAIALNLPPPRISIPREQYIVDYEDASEDDLYETLAAPPVDELERSYSLDEVRYNYELRQRMRRIDLDTVTFEFGAWEVGEDQYRKLDRIARAMTRLLERNPDEVFLIAAHTDGVGSDVDNLSLSDRRAESVAEILTESFGIPSENLVTQGYGRQYLKIDTMAAEPRNRRVEIQRITPLMAER